ncbi:MAG: tyrosine-type recombinase/integrase [Spirochaetia bacterium]|nr:tyrosine-type recombinase/integrase [Spirochaetia bacterium]
MVQEFLASMLSSRTRETYFYGLNRFLEVTGVDPMKASVEHVERFIREKVAGGTKLSTIKTTVNSVRSLAKYLADQKTGQVNLLAKFRLKIPVIKNEEGFRISSRILSPEQVATVIDRISLVEKESGKAVTGAFLFRFLLESGMRISEAVSLDHFDPGKDSPEYLNYLKHDRDRYVVRVLGKTRKLREFKLSESFGALLAEQFAQAVPGSPVFTSARGTRLTRFAARYQILGIQRRFMADMAVHGFGCHALRHTLIGHLLTVKGEHPILVSKTVGNTPEILSRYYLHEGKDVLKDLALIANTGHGGGQ